MLRAAQTTRRGGLNIVGPFEGTSVEADVARRLAGALRAGGVPLSTTSYHRDERDLGSAWSHHGSSDFPFDVNLLVVHPDQMTDFVLDSGPGLFHGRYTIGLWVWDLQAPSPAMADAARMVHEVWTPTSSGCASASSVFAGPVHCVPVPVGGRPSRRDRAALGLPDGFVFASGVDYDSGFVRQNPLGAVEAYTSAFSPTGRPPSRHARSATPTGTRRSTRCSSAPPRDVPMWRFVTPIAGLPPSETAFWRPPTAISRCTGPMVASGPWPRRCRGEH